MLLKSDERISASSMDSSDAAGPDRMAEANTYTCCDVDGYVRIRREPGDGPEPISVPSTLK